MKKFFICDDYIIPHESVLYVNSKKKWIMLAGGGSISLDDEAYDAFVDWYVGYGGQAQCNAHPTWPIYRDAN